jgi:acetylornithine deacetylase/succinyl-diaminopimelate desuccinylase-like protein
MTKTAKLLHELVALPSVNPAFLPPAHPRGGEKRVADFLAATLARAGWDVEFQPVFPDRSNLLARLTPAGKVRRRILLAPHLDTVNGAEDQFSPSERAGRLYGRGACDTKGSVAAMVTALSELAVAGRHPDGTELLFAGLVDEENAQNGSRALAKSGLKADLAIVGEPTNLQIVTAHKGSLWLRLETFGKAAHGSRPELGRNAVHTMAQIVDVLETEYAAMLARRRHPLLGPATVSVGVIAGGIQPNIVPDRCSIQVDRRTLPGETEAATRREIGALLRRHNLKATCTSDKPSDCLPMETNHRLPLVTAFLRKASQRRPAGVNYFCDASILAKGGLSSIVFGPGDIAQAHTRDEWIELAQVEQARLLLERFLRELN